MKITAAVLRDPAAPYVLEEVELADPGPGQVRVRVVGAGMCHTDVIPRAEGSFAPPPIITGHEGSGVVDAVGDDVSTLAVGDHVVLTFDSCGECTNCRDGQPAYCDTMLFRNLSGRALDGSTGVTDADGTEVSSRWFGQSSFATHCIANERNAVKVDPDLPIEKLGPLGCGVQTGAGSVLVALDVRADSSIVVFGAGAVGLSAVMAAVVAGASTIIAVDLHDHRLELARELGATHTIVGSDDDIVGQVHGLTGGGADYAFDTTGVPSVIVTALASLRMAGVCGLVGAQTGDLVLDGLATVGRTIIGILEGGVDPQEFIPRMIGLWKDGRFPFDRLIETFPFSEINGAERSSLSGGAIKPVLLLDT